MSQNDNALTKSYKKPIEGENRTWELTRICATDVLLVILLFDVRGSNWSGSVTASNYVAVIMAVSIAKWDSVTLLCETHRSNRDDSWP